MKHLGDITKINGKERIVHGTGSHRKGDERT